MPSLLLAVIDVSSCAFSTVRLFRSTHMIRLGVGVNSSASPVLITPSFNLLLARKKDIEGLVKQGCEPGVPRDDVTHTIGVQPLVRTYPAVGPIRLSSKLPVAFRLLLHPSPHSFPGHSISGNAQIPLTHQIEIGTSFGSRWRWMLRCHAQGAFGRSHPTRSGSMVCSPYSSGWRGLMDG
jgi:hypothetical protein